MMTHHVTATVTYGTTMNYGDLSDWQREAHQWTVELRYRRRRMTVPFFTGQALTDEPSASDVLYCLASDASGADQSFEDWCADYGYDTDSRTAERTYRQVVDQTARLRRLLGDDFDEIVREAVES